MSGDVTRFPCLICGVGADWPCEPLRASDWPTILMPHKERGWYPFQFERAGYALVDGLRVRPKMPRRRA